MIEWSDAERRTTSGGCLVLTSAIGWTAIVAISGTDVRLVAVVSALALGLGLWWLRRSYRGLLMDDSRTDARRTRKSRLADEPVGRYLFWAPGLAPLIVGGFVSDPTLAAGLASAVLAGTVAWLKYLRRTRPQVREGGLNWFDATLEAYRPNVVGATLAAAVCAAVLVGLEWSDDGLSTASASWFLGIGSAIVAFATYGRFFLTWLDDESVGTLSKVVGAASWLALGIPLLVSSFSSDAAVGVTGISAAILCCGTLEYFRRDAISKRMRALDREGWGSELRSRYGAPAR